MNPETRQIFAGLSPAGPFYFYLLAILSLSWAGVGCWRRIRLWQQGHSVDLGPGPPRWRQALAFGLGPRRLLRRPFAGTLHLLTFSGFLGLGLGSLLLALDYGTPWNFHHGTYFRVYELALDLFGLAFVGGSTLMVYRRLYHAPASLSTCPNELRMLVLLAAIGVTGFLQEGLRILAEKTPPSVALWSPVGFAVAHLLSPLAPVAASVRTLGWWLHAGLALIWIALFPWRRPSHALFSLIHLAVRPVRPPGVLGPPSSPRSLSLPFSWPQLVGLDACMACGRCNDVCPATAAGESLQPKELVQGLRKGMARGHPEEGSAPLFLQEGVTKEALWACTLCQACALECPPLCDPPDYIATLRQVVNREGDLPRQAATALQGLRETGNPWGRPAAERIHWTQGLKVVRLQDHPTPEVLYWVGCAAAWEERAQAAARALVHLLHQAEVDFAILGEEETCTGDVARRLGNEALFQQLAAANVAQLNAFGVRRIVTACPHCFNTLRNEYPALGGDYEVLHHTAFLEGLIVTGRLRVEAILADRVTYHDPCYLGRINGVQEPPRRLLTEIGAEIVEMAHQGPASQCCGAGGGRFWQDGENPGPMSRNRLTEAWATGARTLVTACPFCLHQMGQTEPAGLKVRDVAEVLAERRRETG